MSDVARLPVVQEFDLRPEDILIEDRFRRKWVGDEEIEARRIENLAKKIDKAGQLYPVLVTESEDGKGFVLMDGHRRRRAILLINEKRTRDSKELLKVACRQVEGGDLVQKSLIANIERESYGPMELAMRIQEFREEKGWTGFKGTKRIAEYLGVDAATVTEYEKFLKISKPLQEQLGDGVISAQSALEMIKAEVPEDEQEVVLKRAAEIQQERNKKVSPRALQRRQEKEKKTGKNQSKKIERPAIRQAIREKTGKKSVIALTRKELIESLEVFDGPQYGHANGAVRTFIVYFTSVFAQGRGSIKKMRSLFDAMTAKASKGTYVAEPEPVEKKPKAKKKIQVKAKAKQKARAKVKVKVEPIRKAPKKKK